MTAWGEIEKEHGDLVTTRAREESRWRDIGRLMQADEDFTSFNQKNNPNEGDDPFDSTPLYAHDDFVGGTFTKAVNPAERWFEYGVPSDPDLQQWKPAQEYLWKFTGLINTSLDPTYDNFYLNAPAWFGDLGMWGTGFSWQEEIVGRRTIMSRNFPVGECYKGVDANGELNRFHREFTLTGRQAKGKWPDDPHIKQLRDDQQIKIVLAVYENPEYRPGSPFWWHMRWRSCYVSPDKRDFVVEQGYNEMPVHQIEWSMRSGRVWARGPGHNALPDMRGNDEVVRSTYTAIQFDAEPMWWARDEDVMSTADIAPANILYGDAERGNAPVQTVATEACYAELLYTGVEIVFTPGFSAHAEADVHVGYLDADGLPIALTLGVHFTVTLGGDNAVTVGRIAFPSASPLAPVTITIERITPAVQGVDFENLQTFSAGVHERLADAAAMRDAELRGRQNRTVTPFTVGDEVIDFRPRRVKAADPVDADDLVTKSYADEHTGTAAAAEAKGYRDEVVILAGDVAADAATAEGAANAAAASAAILQSPDYGFYTDIISSNRDYGTYA